MAGNHGATAVVVRSATPADARGIDTLRLQAFFKIFDAVMGPGGDDRKLAALGALRRCAADEVSGAVVAVTADGVIVGHAAYRTTNTYDGSGARRARAILASLGPLRTLRFLVARQTIFIRHDVAPGEAYVFDIAVAPAWRGRRIADRVVAHLEQLAAAAGAIRGVALVGTANASSRSLMARLGYAEAGLVRNRWRGRAVGEGELVRYVKTL